MDIIKSIEHEQLKNKIPELKGATLLASTYGNREATLLRSYEVRVYKVKK